MHGSRDNGARVITYPKNSPPADNQLWHLDYLPDGTFLIISELHGKALDCGRQTQGTKLVVCDRHGSENQRWRMEGNHIVSMSGSVMEVEKDYRELGTPLVLGSRKGHPSNDQLFDIVHA